MHVITSVDETSLSTLEQVLDWITSKRAHHRDLAKQASRAAKSDEIAEHRRHAMRLGAAANALEMRIAARKAVHDAAPTIVSVGTSLGEGTDRFEETPR